MADILGLGLSHYPGPSVPVEAWPTMLEKNVELGRVTPDLYADKSRWPAEMRAEWGSDDGVTAAKAHRARLMAGYDKLRDALDAFRPDIVFIRGDDQYENFKRECIPAFCVGVFDKVVGKPLSGTLGPFKTKANAWNLPTDTELTIRGHYQGSSEFVRFLLDDGFDVAYLMETRDPRGLAHSFNNTIMYLDHWRRPFEYPVIPFHVNCYGNQLMKVAAGTESAPLLRRRPRHRALLRRKPLACRVDRLVELVARLALRQARQALSRPARRPGALRGSRQRALCALGRTQPR